MNRTQLIHRLRIAVSVFFAVVAVALCVLWVRSYYTTDTLRGPLSATKRIWITSSQGQVNFSGPWRGGGDHQWALRLSSSDIPRESLSFARPFRESLCFAYGEEYPIRFAIVPYWFFVLAAGTLASVTWLRWRFGVRTLLIATTLVAVVLGLTMWRADSF